MSTGLHQYSRFVAFSTFLLIIAGGLVTSTGSGLSVPDWPLSYGQMFPPMIGGIRFEHTHRVIAGFVGCLTLILAVIIYLKEKRSWVKWLGFVAVLAVVAQAVLGGITVIYLLPTVVSVLHACLAQTFFSLLAALCLFTSQEWKGHVTYPCQNASSIQRLLVVTTIFIYLQLVTGAIVRHTKGEGLLYHLTLAGLIAMHAIFILVKIAKENEIRKKFLTPAICLLSLVLLQILLGSGVFVLPLSRVLVTTAHQANGALILATGVVFTLRAFRCLKVKMAAA